MRALFLQFEEWDGPELLGEVLTRSGVPWDAVRLDLPHNPIDLDRYGLLIGLGGAMNADEADRYPFLGEARSLLGMAVEQDLPVVGVCLSGQLLARALGAEVVRMEQPEVGLVPVRIVTMGDPLLEGIPNPLPTAHFHEDTFRLPVGAVLLASSVACETQIARMGPRAYALQFHPEISAATFARWIESDYTTVTGDRSESAGSKLVAAIRDHEPALRQVTERLVGNLLTIARADPGARNDVSSGRRAGPPEGGPARHGAGRC